MQMAFTLQFSVYLSHILKIPILYQLPENNALSSVNQELLPVFEQKVFCVFFFLLLVKTPCSPVLRNFF